MSTLNEIRENIKSYALLTHPFYQAWMQGTLELQQLQHYAQQYVPFVDAFPRLVSTVHGQCADAASRKEIFKNLMEEEGVGFAKDHPELWQDFVQGIGAKLSVSAGASSAGSIGPKAQELVDTYFVACRASYAQGLGALLAYEIQSAEISESKIEGLQKNYGIHEQKTLAFFNAHQVADQEHSHSCALLLDKLSPSERAEALAATERAAKALWDFLSEVYAPCPQA